MRLIFSEDALEFQRAVKKAFDPRGLLNPDKIVPPPIEESPVDEPPTRVSEVREAGETSTASDEFTADLVPADVAEARQMVQQAFARKRLLQPLGRGSRWQDGNGNGTVCLRSTKLAEVIEHDHVNQVVTVQSGMPLSELQAILAEHRQWLPLRPPRSDRCTVGGVAALNASGPDRLHYGAPRDLLLGLRFVSGTGRLVNSGGRVVKNVAGYDLTRLLCGSAGTLGFLTELTFRTLPLPDCCMALEVRASWEECAEAASGLLDSPLEPAFVAATPCGDDADGGPWQLRVGYEGFTKTVENQAQRTLHMFEQSGLQPSSCRAYGPGEDLFAKTFAVLHSDGYRFRLDVPLGCLRNVVAQAWETLRDADSLADFGCGRLSVRTTELSDATWQALCRLAGEAEGHAVLENAPRRHVDGLGIATRPGPERDLVCRLKSELDPHGVFGVWDAPLEQL